MTLTSSEASVDLWQHRSDPEVVKTLVEIYAPLVVYVARRVAATAPLHVDRDDFISYGHFGLMDAVRRFDPTRNIKFETFASRRIRGSILDGLRSADPLTRNARKRVRDARIAIHELEGSLQREPTTTEVCEAVGVSSHELAMTMLDGLAPLPIVADSSDEDRAPMVLTDTAQDDPQICAELSGMRRRLAELLCQLPDRDRQFIAHYYVEGKGLIEVGGELGISDSRAGQIRLEIIRSLARRARMN